MPETLLSQSNVILFGRPVEDLEIKAPAANPRHGPFEEQRKGANTFVEDQLTWSKGTGKTKETAIIARIYGFSFEGKICEFPRPVLMLVHGEGREITEDKGKKDERKRQRAPESPDETGLPWANFDIANDMRAWSYDRSDYSMMMVQTNGTLDQLLGEVCAASAMAQGGQSGTMLSGTMLSGTMLSGTMLSGTMLSGTMLSGTMLSGARKRNE